MNKYVAILFLFISTAFVAQNSIVDTIIIHDFTNQNGKGAYGGFQDVSGCNWTIDVSAASLSNQYDYFQVVNEKLEAQDVDGNCIWYSPLTNISYYEDVSLSISASESGGLENSDIINSEYRVDGGPWSYFATNGQRYNDFGSMTISQSGLSGSTVEIRVTINVDQSNEQIRIDDIVIKGINTISNCDTLDIIVASSPNTQYSNDTIRNCNADSVLLDASSGFQSYLWSNGATTQQTYVKYIGDYSLIVTDSNGCSIDFAHVDFLNTSILHNDTTICRTDSLVLNGSSSTGNYEVLNTTPTIDQMGTDIDGSTSNYLSLSHSGSHSIAMNAAGDKMVVGASNENRVSVYTWNGSSWDTEQNIYRGYSYFGCSVDMNAAGDRIVVGAYNSNRAFTYSWNGSSWNHEASLSGSTHFGWDVSMSNGGDTIAVSEPYYAYRYRGRVKTYAWNGSSWNNFSNTSYGEYNYDYFGRSIALSGAGDRLIVGSYSNDGGGYNSGHVRVYELSGTSWVKMGADINGNSSGDYFGWSVDINNAGDRIIVGATRDDNGGSNSGSVRVFDWNGSSWSQVGSQINGSGSSDNLGNSVAINNSGDKIIVGIPYEDESSSNAGQARVFQLKNNTWQQIANNINGESSSDYFGNSSAMNASGNRFAVGAYLNDGGGSNSGHVRVFELNYPDTTANYPITNLLWSTNETDSSITVSPYQTTTYTLTSSNGNTTCQDSILVTVSHDSIVLDTTVCDRLIMNGKSYTTSGSYVDSLTNTLGCDSIIYINLTVHPIFEASPDYIDACSSTTWRGNTYTTTGIYYDSLQTIHGCDSVYILDFTKRSYEITDVQIGCDSFSWNGNTYTTSGSYTDTIINSFGCDSIVTLQLTVNSTYTTSESQTACHRYKWNGTTYYSSGTYIDTLTSIGGCDSVATLSLTINDETSSNCPSAGMHIKEAEFFWGTTDPGEGNGISMLPIDRAVTLYSEYFDSITFLTSWTGDTGVIRGKWGSTYGGTSTSNTGPFLGINGTNYLYFESGWADPSGGSPVVFLEEFTNQDGLGVTQYGPYYGNANWSITANSSNFLDNNDYFKVVNGVLQAKDLNANCYWHSPVVDISDYANIEVSLDIWEVGNLTNFDYVNCEYRVDGGSWSYFSNNGFNVGNFNNVVASQNNINGSTLEIRLTVNVDEQIINFDNFKVKGAVSSSNGNIQSYIQSQPIEIPNIFDSVDLHFKIHAYGAGVGDFEVQISNNYGTSFQSVYSQSGPIQTNQSNDFLEIKKSIRNYVGDAVIIRFLVNLSNASNAHLGDIAIEDVEIHALSNPGVYNEVVEYLIAQSPIPPTDSLVLLNVRVKDEDDIWGPVYKRVLLNYDTSALRDLAVKSAEYFWDNDPGFGSGTSVQVLDGNYNEVIEAVYNDSLSYPTTNGLHQLSIRVKDEDGIWGPTFKRAVYISSIQDLKITAAEFFFGTTDPGAGSGNVLLVLDGNYNEAFESILSSSLSVDTGFNLLNVRVRDLNNNWGPLFKKTIYKNDSSALRDIQLTQAEYFWDTLDPGQGSANALIVFDGQFNEAFETAFANSSTAPPNDSINLLNVRFKDESGNWGPLYKRVLLKYDSSNAIRDLKITEAEFYWDIDPGQGSGTSMLVLDGQFDEAIEAVYKQSNSLGFGFHSMGIRVKDEEGIWGPTYKRTMYVGFTPQDLKVTAAEYFFGTSDPGQGSGTTMLVMDGNFNEAIETVIKSNIALDSGFNLLNVRVKDLNNNWGPLFKKTIYLNDSSALRDLHINTAEFFWGTTDPGTGNATALLVFDGQFNEALELVFKDSNTAPTTDSLVLLNLRIKDESGNWGPLYKRVLLQYDSSFAHRDIKISQAEYFWDTDPGVDNGIDLTVLDGQFDEAIEHVYHNADTIGYGSHVFGIRVKDEDNQWGSTYRRVIFINSLPQDIKITNAEYFIGTSDPGAGSASALVIFDGQFDEAIETVTQNNLSLDTGFNLLNIRVRDLNDNWGPLFKKVIYRSDSTTLRDQKITQAEFFWDTIDPGAGSATPLLVFDGNFNEAIEIVFKDSATSPISDSLVLLNLRIKDEDGNWGPLYKRILLQYDSSFAFRDLKITESEYFWDTDPGAGNANTMLVFDGNYDHMLETIFDDTLLRPDTNGLHVLGIRTKDEDGVWGPVFRRTAFISEAQDMTITIAEYFWGTSDPGEGSGTNMLVFDGQFDEAIETVTASNIVPDTGFNLLNVRVRDLDNNWGPIFKKTIFKNDSSLIQDLSLITAEFFWDTIDPGIGNATTLLAFDGDFNEAFEVVFKDSATAPPNDSLNLFNVRVKDNSGNWSSLYKRVFLKYDSSNAFRDLKITNAEYFWDIDPGLGSAQPMIVFDGNYNQALENVYINDTLTPNSTGTHQFGIRAKDEDNEWGLTYYRAIYINGLPQNIAVSAGEFFWGTTDPGEGSGTVLLAFDGQYDEAIEKVMKYTLQPDTGFNLLNVRVRDQHDNWGPLFKKVIYSNDSSDLRDIEVSSAEFFWDTIDPGIGNATSLLVFDGNYNEALELVLRDSATSPPNDSLNLLNIRVRDEDGNWGPLYKRLFLQYDSSFALREIELTFGEFFWGTTDPGLGNGVPILSFDGSFDEELELLFTSNLYSPGGDTTVFNLRVKDEEYRWGPLYKRTIINNLPQYQLEIVNLGVSDTICYGDSINLEAIGSSSFEWLNTSIITADTGKFTKAFPSQTIQIMVVGDNYYSGIDTAYYTIYVEQLPDFEINSSVDSLCIGETVTFNAVNSTETIDTLIYENFENYGNGYDYIGNNSSNWINNGGTSSPATLYSFGNGAGGSNSYLVSANGWNKLQYSFSAIDGVTYHLKFNGALTAYYGNNLKIQVIQLNGPGDLDDVILQENLWTDNNSNILNIWQAVNYSYTANTSDALSMGGIAFRLFKTYGTGFKIDDFSVTYTSQQTGTYFYSWSNGVINSTNTISPTYDSTLYLTGTSSLGCVNYDSASIIVNYPTSSPAIVDTACNSYTLNGQTFTSSGTYQQILTNSKGCDSTVTLELQVNYSDDGVLPVIACDSFNYNNSTMYFNSGYYTHLYSNRFGCDSTEHLDLTVYYASYDTLNITSCESYFVNQHHYYSSGTYHQTLVNNDGCDSLLTLNITITQNTFGSEIETACDSYTDPVGNTYSQSGIYQYTLTNSIGCDSLVTLSLDIRNSSAGIDYQSACNEYTWMDSIQYTSSTTLPTYTLTNAVGCDSVVNLDLTIFGPTYGTEIVNVCDSFVDPLGTVYNSSGSYAYTLPNAQGCDSVVSLQVNILRTSSVLYDTICSGIYYLNNVLYSSSGTYQQVVTNASGCDSVITLNLEIQDDLGVDFSANQQVFLNPPFDVEFSNNTPDRVLKQFTWDFGDGTTLQSNGPTANHSYSHNGFYDVSLICTYVSTGCQQEIREIEYIFCMGGPDDTTWVKDVSAPDVNLYPNPTSGIIHVEVENYIGTITTKVYDVSGKLVYFTNAQQVDLSPFERGTYLFTVNYANRNKTVRVIKQ